MTTSLPTSRPGAGRLEGGVGLLIVALLSAFYAAYFAARPTYNWDMVAYVAVALLDEGTAADRVHDVTYDLAKQAEPAAAYADLTDGNDYRRLVAGDAARFAEQLPFYTVKPVYPWLMSLLHRAGIELVAASVAIAAAAYAGISLLLYIWLVRWLKPLVAVPVMALLALCPYLTPLAHLSTPDSLSVLTLLATLFCLTEAISVAAGLVLLALAILVRPENVVYAVVLPAWLAWTGRLRPLRAAAAILVMIAVYLATTRWSGNYGWTTLFYFTYVDDTIDLARFVSPLGLGDYVRIYVQQIDKAVFLPSEGVPLFLLVGLGVVLLKWRRPASLGDRYLQLALLGVAFIVLRTLAFPGDAHRALVAPYLMLVVAFVQACAALAATRDA